VRRPVIVTATATVMAAALGALACKSKTLEGETAEAAKLYPDLFALYAGDQGIYRGCGPSGGVCHNANEFPNLDSVGSILDNIGRSCNQKRADPSTLNDLCERPGDFLTLGDGKSEIAWIEEADAATRTFRIHLREPVTMGSEVQILRQEATVFFLDYYGTTAAADPGDPSGATVLLTAPPPAMPTEEDDEPFDVGAFLGRAGIPGDPEVIQVGDPNHNGTFGAALGGKIIHPGDPARSYLIARLTDPNAGPLMPRANCCHWSKPALRALYCWVEGLHDDGGNALAPIDYAGCSGGPSVDLLYPDPGPYCEAMGRCPVEVADVGDRDPTFHNVYARILMPTCSGADCHAAGALSGLEMTSEDKAYAGLASRVVPGNPEASLLFQRISPELCVAPDCLTMPLGQAPLPEDERELVRSWIEMGAER